MTLVPGTQMESSFCANDDDSNDNNESEMYLIVDEDLPELSDENASTSTEQQCSSFSSSNLDSSSTLIEMKVSVEENSEDPQFVVKESCDCSPPSSSNKITTMMKLNSGSKAKQTGNVKAKSAINGVRSLMKSKPFKRGLKFAISQKKTYECSKKGNVKAKGIIDGVRTPTKSEPLKRGVKLIFSRKKTYETLSQSSESRNLPKVLFSLLKNRSAQRNYDDTDRTEKAPCESQKSFGNRSKCTPAIQSSKKGDTWLRQVKFKEQQLDRLCREKKAQRSADDIDGAKDSPYESQKLFGNWSKHTPTGQSIQTGDNWLQQELLKEQQSNRLLREENMILSENLSYLMSGSTMDSQDNHSALQSQDNTYNDIHHDYYPPSSKASNSWNPKMRVVPSKSKPVQKPRKRKTLRKKYQTKNMNCHNGQKIVLSRDPNKVLLPDPNKSLLPDPNRVLLPDPKKVLLPDPKKVFLPDPNKTLLPDPNKTLLPDPNKTLLPDPNIFLLPDPNKVFLSEPNKFLLPDPNTVLLTAPNKFLLPAPNKVLLPAPNKVLLPDPNEVLPEINKVLLPNPNKVLLPDPNGTLFSNPKKVLLPDPNKVSLADSNKVLLPESKKSLLPEPVKKCLLPGPVKGLLPDHKPRVPLYSSQSQKFKHKRRLRRKTNSDAAKLANLPIDGAIRETQKYPPMSDSDKVLLPEPNKVLLPDPKKGLLSDHRPIPVYSAPSKRYNCRFKRKTSSANLPPNAIQEVQRYLPMPEPNRVLLSEPNKVLLRDPRKCLLPNHEPSAPVYSSQSERYDRRFKRESTLADWPVDSASQGMQRYSPMPERYLSESDRSSLYYHTGSFQDTYCREPFHLSPSDEFY